MTAPVEAETLSGMCEAQTSPEVRYLSNGDPGYPAEYCENDAAPGSVFCPFHAEAADAEDAWYAEHESSIETC